MNIVDVSRMWTIFPNITTIHNTWKGLIKRYLKMLQQIKWFIDLNYDYFMQRYEFVGGEYICWWCHNTNQVIKYSTNFIQADRPIRLQYSNQIKLIKFITGHNNGLSPLFIGAVAGSFAFFVIMVTICIVIKYKSKNDR